MMEAEKEAFSSSAIVASVRLFSFLHHHVVVDLAAIPRPSDEHARGI
jgi:hypothetical protein